MNVVYNYGNGSVKITGSLYNAGSIFFTNNEVNKILDEIPFDFLKDYMKKRDGNKDYIDMVLGIYQDFEYINEKFSIAKNQRNVNTIRALYDMLEQVTAKM